MITDNRGMFSTAEFDRWANQEAENAALLPEERFLIERFFDKQRSTVEAGTGGGRVVLALEAMGFENLTGFDFVPEMIERARRRRKSNKIRFEIQDAVHLTYPDQTFDQAMYLQQVLCFIDSEEDRLQALREARRILKPGSPAIFTALNFESRQFSSFYGFFLIYLRLLRRRQRIHRSIQSMPWIRPGNRLNSGALLDSPPYTYWYRAEEFVNQIAMTGFEIIGFATSSQLCAGDLHTSISAFMQDFRSGHLYVVCRRQ